MIEMIEDPRNSYYALVNETRDYLNALMRAGGPDYTYYKLAEKLRTVTPRFDWQDRDVEGFIKHPNKPCRFYVSPYAVQGKKENRRPLLSLAEVAAMRDFAAAELEPLLKILRDTGAKLDVPDELTVSSGVNELWLSFQTATQDARYLAFNQRFYAAGNELFRRLIDVFLAERDRKPADPPASAAEPPPPSVK